MFEGRLLESTGRYGLSRLLLREIDTGRVVRQVALDVDEFGEGTTAVGTRIVQLTWRSGRGHVYDSALHKLHDFPLAGEGWGLAFDGKRLVRSDGSATLHFLDPETLADTGSVEVRNEDRPITQLNELEAAGGLIYANVWHTDEIAAIDPASGQVRGWIDLYDLRRRFMKPADWNEAENVLNGIAYDPASGHFYVTGKCWPRLFEIAIEHGETIR